MMMTPLLLRYDLSPCLTAFSTTRHGGCSIGRHGQFNINEYCGDKAESIAANRRALASMLSISPERIITPRQVHGCGVRLIGAEFPFLSSSARRLILNDTDALMTAESGLLIGVSTADCVPVIIYDGEHKAVAVVHAGWRGTVRRVVRKVVSEMRLAFSSRPEALFAQIGPGISVDAFEVGDEVYEQFAAASFDMSAIARREEKWHIDLWRCNLMQLCQSGVRAANIKTAGICTFNHSDDFFSARRLGVDSGRILTAAMLR